MKEIIVVLIILISLTLVSWHPSVNYYWGEYLGEAYEPTMLEALEEVDRYRKAERKLLLGVLAKMKEGVYGE